MNKLLVLLTLCVLPFTSAYAQFLQKQAPEISDNSFIVLWDEKAKKDKNGLNMLSSVNGVRNFNYLTTIDVVSVSSPTLLKEAMTETSKMRGVRGVYPNYKLHALQSDTTPVEPNDPLYSSLWGLNNTDTGFDINAPEAWSVTTGSEDVYVVVIDTGIDYSHEDLTDNMWVNTDEIPDNGIDDDGNGWVDDIYGIDTYDYDGDPFDDSSHGTHVAGTIAGVGNNEVGVTGIGWNTKLIACKFLGVFGGTTEGALACLDYVLSLKIEKGLNIVATNNSWGGGGYSEPLYEAIAEQMDEGILFVAAAGNSSNDNDIYPSYPASYDLPNIISVAASDISGQLAYFSSYGLSSVDIVAPGVDIMSSVPGNEYALFSGTSMASPHVAGSVALLKANDPTLNWIQVKNLLLSTAASSKLNEGLVASGDLLLWGAEQNGAINCENIESFERFSPAGYSTSVDVGGALIVEASNTNCSEFFAPPSLIAFDQEYSLNDSGADGDRVAGDGIYSIEIDVNWIGSASFFFEDVVDSEFEVISYEPIEVIEIPYNYIDIEGEPIDVIEYGSVPLQLDFPVTLPNGKITADLFISMYGVVAFDENYYAWYNAAIPTGYEQSFIGAFWDDLLSNEDSLVSYAVLGEAPNRQVIIEYRDMGSYYYSYGGTGDENMVTFQVVLSESTPEVVVNYKDVTAPDLEFFDSAGEATIGVQFDGNGSQYSFNDPVLSDEMSLLYTADGSDRPTITEFSIEGLFRPNQMQVVNLNATSELEDVVLTAQLSLDGGESYSDIVLGEPQEISLDLGLHFISVIVSDGNIQVFASKSININPYTDVELELIDQSIQTGIEIVVSDPGVFGLVSLEDADPDGFLAGQQSVLNAPSGFGLYTEEEYNLSYSSGQDSVLADPALFDLFTHSDIEQSFIDGQEDVMSSPSDYGLFTDVDVADSRLAGQVDVTSAPADFGLFTETEIASSRVAGQEDVMSSPSDYGLFTDVDVADSRLAGQVDVTSAPADFGLFTETEIAGSRVAGQEDVMSSPSDYGLFTDVDVADSRLAGQVDVTSAPVDFGLFTETEVDQSRVNGQGDVVSSPAEFGLFTSAELEQSRANGQSDVVNAPAVFGLFTGVEFDAAVIDAKAAQVAEIAANPAEFGYKTIETSIQEVTQAATAATQSVIDDPETHGLTVIVNSASDIAALPEGVHLIGLSIDVANVAEFFGDVNYVWAYRDGQYHGYIGNGAATQEQITNSGFGILTSLTAGEGVWISK